MTTLSPYELQIVDLIEKGLKTHVGKENAVTGRVIVQKLKAKGFKLNGGTVRSAVHYLRTVRKMMIVGDSFGYYLAANDEEILHQIKSLKSRIREITEVLDAITKTRSQMVKQPEIFEL